MSKYKIRRVGDKKTVLAQAGLDEMTNIVDTKESHSANPFMDIAIDPEAIAKGTAGLDFVKGRESVNPEYGMFTGAPGEGMPIEFSMTAQEMDFLNKNPKLKREYETKKLREFLEKTKAPQLNQVMPKLESLYAIYLQEPDAKFKQVKLDKLREEARMIRQLSPSDKTYLMTKPYWPLIQNIVK